jgi:hypothetical protein
MPLDIPLAPDLPLSPTFSGDDLYVEMVMREAAQAGKILTPADVWSTRDAALQELANEVAEDPARRAYAQTQVTSLAFASGGSSLATYTDALHEHIRNVTHDDGGGNITNVAMLPYGASRKDLGYERLDIGLYYGVVESAQIYIAAFDGSSAPNGTLNFVYSNVPTLATIHIQLVDDLIRCAVVLSERVAQRAMQPVQNG